MDYKKMIEPDLITIATNPPYNRLMIWLANVYLRIACKFLPIEEGIKCRNIHIKGFNNLDLKLTISETFDIVLCSMMLMDCEDFEGTLKEAYRTSGCWN